MSDTVGVGEFLQFAREHVQHFMIQGLWIEGEVSNLSRPRSGHVYFSLKEADSQVRCVMFKGRAAKISDAVSDGDRIKVQGSCDLYVGRGDFQLIISDLKTAGVGDLLAQLEALKERLREEGLFDNSRALPRYPTSIAMITSATGAAVEDLKTVLSRRWPAPATLYPAVVQGDGAVDSIVAALQRAFGADHDVIIVGRGGGSIEDLWAFNSEKVARCVAASPVPIISAVGHETDTVLSDFAADLRAPTPSAAAELVVPDRSAVIDLLHSQLHEQQQLIVQKINDLSLQADRLLSRVPNPQHKLESATIRLTNLLQRLHSTVQQRQQLDVLQLAQLRTLIQDRSVETVLSRGYSLAIHDGSVVQSVNDIPQQPFELRLADGSVEVKQT